MSRIHLLFAVSDRDMEEEFSGIVRQAGIHDQYAIYGHGTVEPGVLELLGLEKTEKSVLLGIGSEENVHKSVHYLNERVGLGQPGRGIALSLPLKSADRRLVTNILPETVTFRQEEQKMVPEMEMIIVIVNRGTTELVSQAARQGGATGGTVVHAKDISDTNIRHFGALSIAAEKDILFIAVPVSCKKDVMHSIITHAGPESEANSIVFSLPVTEAAGLRMEEN